MAEFDNPPIKQRRRRWLISAAVLALLALVYSGFWFMLAINSRDKVIDWIDAQRSLGFSVRYDSLEATGFPLSIRLEFINPGFGAPNTTRPWGWEGAHLSLFFKPWNISAVHARTSGPQMLAMVFKGKTETFNGEAGGVEVDLELSAGTPDSVGLRIEKVVLEADTPGLAAIQIDQARIHVQRLVMGKADYQTASASLDATVKGFAGPWLTSSPLASSLQRLTINARQMGSFDQGSLIQSLENWRDSGGTIEIGKFSLQHGPVKISADGTLALDDRLQPIGALTARIEGFHETIDALQRVGVVKARDAITAKIVLGVLARKPENGGPAHLNLALSAQGQKLYAGPLALMTIPQIDWRAFRK